MTEKRKAYMKEYRRKNKDKLKKAGRKYREENKEVLKVKKKEYEQRPEVRAKLKENRKRPEAIAARKAYRRSRSEKDKEYSKKWREANREDIRKKHKVWQQTLNGKYVIYKRGAKSRGLGFHITKEDMQTFWQQPCYYCETEIGTIGLDRVDNSQGYTLDNIVPCCKTCNTMKMASTQEEFFQKIAAIYHTNASRNSFESKC